MTGRALRLALSMRGGVSLAVWIGGAAAEIDALRWDLAEGREPVTTLGLVAHALGTTSVEIDVVSGTSAGGLNGVALGTAMANCTSVEGLRHVWLHTADLAALMRPGGWKRHPSILDSEQFLRRARAAICAMGQGPGGGQAPPALARLEAYFPVTSVVPATTTAWADPLAPVSERRIGGWIWLHHPADTAASDDAVGAPLPSPPASDFRLDPPGGAHHDTQVDALALTICSTAAFPLAFAPTRIPDTVLPERVRFPDGRRPDPLFLYDGGVVDNMPVGRAVSAISRAPADGPTQRVLVYMHPSPGANRTSPDPSLGAMAGDERPAPVDVARSAFNLLEGKSLVDDLRGLEQHNETVRWHLRDRAAALAAPVPAESRRDDEVVRATVAAHDAERLTSLLCDPTPHLEALGPDALQDGWLRAADGATRQRWVRALTDRIRADALDLRPWSAFIRTTSRLVEWARWLEAAGGGPEVSDAKQEIHLLRTGALREASELDRRTLLALAEQAPLDAPTDPVTGAGELVRWRRLVLDDRVTGTHVEAAWVSLAEHASVLAARHTASGAGAGIEPTSPTDALPAALADRLEGADEPPAVRRALQHLDDDLLAVHGHAPTGSLDQVRYHTLAGTAPTPLSTCFPWPDGHRPADLPLVLDPLEDDDGEPDPLGRLDPAGKLAGNQLMKFAAFLDVSWRANDWMWGRADAADTIVRLLVDPTLPIADPARAAETVRDACTSDRWPVGIDPAWIDDLTRRARQPWGDHESDESDTIVRVRAELEGDEPRTLTHAVVAWRRHLEVLALELSRPRVENPNPVAPGPGQEHSFATALAGWAQPTRTLASRWGRAPEAALGVSAVFLTVRTLLGRTPWWRWLVEAMVSPLAGPVVGVVLARRRGVAAAVVALAGVTLPRTYGHTVGSILATLLIVIVAGGGAWVTRGPGPTFSRWRDASWSVVALVLAATATVSSVLVWVDDDHLAAARRGWLPETDLVGDELIVVSAVAAVLATWWIWFWVRTTVRVGLSALIGALVGSWVWLGAEREGPLWPLAPVEAIAWCLVAVVGLTSLVGFNVPRLARPDSGGGPRRGTDPLDVDPVPPPANVCPTHGVPPAPGVAAPPGPG